MGIELCHPAAELLYFSFAVGFAACTRVKGACQAVHRGGIAALRPLAVPGERGGVTLRRTAPVVVAMAKFAHRPSVSALGGFLEPCKGLYLIARNTIAVLVAVPHPRKHINVGEIGQPSRRDGLGPLVRLEGVKRYFDICHLLFLSHTTNMNFDTSTPNAAMILRKTLSSCQR